MTKERPPRTELEKQFASPDGADVRRKVCADLAEIELRLLGRIARMVPRDEFASYEASLEAVRAAQTIVNRWKP